MKSHNWNRLLYSLVVMLLMVAGVLYIKLPARANTSSVDANISFIPEKPIVWSRYGARVEMAFGLHNDGENDIELVLTDILTPECALAESLFPTDPFTLSVSETVTITSVITIPYDSESWDAGLYYTYTLAAESTQGNNSAVLATAETNIYLLLPTPFYMPTVFRAATVPALSNIEVLPEESRGLDAGIQGSYTYTSNVGISFDWQYDASEIQYCIKTTPLDCQADDVIWEGLTWMDYDASARDLIQLAGGDGYKDIRFWVQDQNGHMAYGKATTVLFANGDFSDGFDKWESGASSTILEPSLTTENTALLGTGDPSYNCGGALQGWSTISRTLDIDTSLLTSGAEVQIVFDYEIHTEDKLFNPYYDFDRFVLSVDEHDLFWNGYTGSDFGCNNYHVVTEEGKTQEIPSADLADGVVSIVLANILDYDNYYNTYTYVDNVRVVVVEP